MATSLSAGLAVYDLLSADQYISETVSTIFPVLIASDGDIRLPYICFNRERIDQVPTKVGYPGADTAQMAVAVYWDTDHYTDLIHLTEKVREALDCKQYVMEPDGINMRSCYFTDAREYGDEEGHIVQELIFTIKM